MIVKILLIAAILGVMVWVMRARPTGRRLALTRMATLVLALSWVVAVLRPSLVSWVAQQIGVGRGTDLVLYLLVVAFTFTSIGQYQRLRHLDDRMAEMTRVNALLERRVTEMDSRQGAE